MREAGVPGAGQREAFVYPSSDGVRFARICRAHPPRRPFMELRGFSRPVRFYSQSGGNVVLRLDFVRRQAAGAGRTAMGMGMVPGASHSGFFRFPVCPADDGCGSCGASSAFAVFCMRMAVLEACGGQKAGVVHCLRDDAGAAHRGCRVLEAGGGGESLRPGAQCGMAGARHEGVFRLAAREGQGSPDGGKRGLPGACPGYWQFPAYDEHQAFPFSEKPGVPG